MFYVDLNSDLGESFGNYTIGMDEEILQYVSSANVACGWHAGDPMVMDKTIALAKKYGTAVGAHPGFPDLMGFGRRNMVVTPEEAKAYLKYQLGALSAFTKSQGVKIQELLLPLFEAVFLRTSPGSAGTQHSHPAAQSGKPFGSLLGVGFVLFGVALPMGHGPVPGQEAVGSPYRKAGLPELCKSLLKGVFLH